MKRRLAGAGYASILDIGCGTGDFADVSNGEYMGIDATPSFIDYARRVHGGPGKRFLTMDATRMDFPPDSFDASILVDVIHHLPDELLVSVLRDAARVSRQAVVIWDIVSPPSLAPRSIFHRLNRGSWMRPIQAQINPVHQSGVLRVFQVDRWWARFGFYEHSILFCRPHSLSPPSSTADLCG